MVVRGLLGPPQFAGQGQSLIRGGPGSTHGVETAILGCTGFGIWGSLSALTPPRTRGTAGAGGVESWEGSLSPTWGCSRSFAAGRGMNAANMSGLVLACPRSLRCTGQLEEVTTACSRTALPQPHVPALLFLSPSRSPHWDCRPPPARQTPLPQKWGGSGGVQGTLFPPR